VSRAMGYERETFVLVVALHLLPSTSVLRCRRHANDTEGHGRDLSTQERGTPLPNGPDPLLRVQPKIAVGDDGLAPPLAQEQEVPDNPHVDSQNGGDPDGPRWIDRRDEQDGSQQEYPESGAAREPSHDAARRPEEEVEQDYEYAENDDQENRGRERNLGAAKLADHADPQRQSQTQLCEHRNHLSSPGITASHIRH
jgi:hypothetical protein